MSLDHLIGELLKAVDNFGVNLPVIGYTNGLVIVGLLLFIWSMLMRKRASENLPLFCGKCGNSRHSLFGDYSYCHLKCKYNPPMRTQAIKSFYKET